MQLRQKIELLKREQFDAASMVKQSAVLTKTIRDCGVQMVNHDIECQGRILIFLKIFSNNN